MGENNLKQYCSLTTSPTELQGAPREFLSYYTVLFKLYGEQTQVVGIGVEIQLVRMIRNV